MKVMTKVKELASDARLYWKKPPLGKYINFRSIFAYSFGGIGVYAIVYLYNTINVTATNVVISNATGIPPTDLLLMYYLTFFANVFFTGARAKIVDNARSKKGKYRPYILYMGIPSALLTVAMVWFPYDLVKSYFLRWTIVFILNMAMQFFYQFFYEAYENLIFVMSPNSQERSNVASIKSVIYSFAPTVLNPLIPLMVKWLHASDMYDIRIYRALYPPVALIGIILTVIVYGFTEERIIQAKTHVVQIRFTDALRAVAKNKYFWIISLAGWIGFLESTQGYILGWLYTYAGMCTDGQYSIITLIYGNASLWGMLAAPFAIKRWGKKKVLIVTNALNIVFIALLYPSINVAGSIWLVLLSLYLNALVGSFSHILTPSISADIRDYQQYISGERIDGMFAAVGLIGTFINLILGTVTPMIFDRYGINDHNGYANAFDILKYEPDTLFSLINLLILLSVIGAALNVIPYFFYDLSELKQKGIVRILKIRALFEDYGNNALNDGELVEAVDLVRKSKEYAAKEPIKFDAKEYRKKRKAADKAGKKALKAERQKIKETNEEIEISKMVEKELNKFSSEPVKKQLINAKIIYKGGLQGIYSIQTPIMKEVRQLPKNTPDEKQIRSDSIDLAKNLLIGKRCAVKYFPDGIPELDYNKYLRELFEEEDTLSEKIRLAYSSEQKTEKSLSKEQRKAKFNEIKTLHKKKNEISKKIKKVSNLLSLYNRAEKSYFDAQRLIRQEQNYCHFDEIEKLYDGAKERYEASLKAKEEEAKELEAKRAAEKEALRKAKKKK